MQFPLLYIFMHVYNLSMIADLQLDKSIDKSVYINDTINIQFLFKVILLWKAKTK